MSGFAACQASGQHQPTTNSHTEKSSDAVHLVLKGCGQFTQVKRQDMDGTEKKKQGVSTAVVKKTEFISTQRGMDSDLCFG